MFENVGQAIDWVCGRRHSEHRESGFRDYLHELGDPQLQLRTIHVAGTNGKGSTTNYLRAILQSAGYKTGSFTSPHLVTHLDRIRINDVNIDEQYFLDSVNRHKEEWEAHDLAMFEIDMLISTAYFLDNQVDIAVYEVGLGGRKDPTNVISPIGAVITNIEMDHMAILGDTISQIAFEKAGIIKDHLPVVTFERKPEALEQFYRAAALHDAEIIEVPEIRNLTITDHCEFDCGDRHFSLASRAPYQCLNGAGALTLIDRLNASGAIKVSEAAIQAGLKSEWAGRFEIVHQDPKVILDGAHNENGIAALCEAIAGLSEDVTILFSALKDKRYAEMLGMLVKQGEVIVTEFENQRRASALELAEGHDVRVIADHREALRAAMASGRTVIVTGSLYFISLIRAILTEPAQL